MRLILISIDAVSGVDAAKLLSLPNIRHLAENGAFLRNMQTVYPTLTYPIHASIMTGCYPDRHGIAHNHLSGQLTLPPKMRKWYWEIGQIRCKTLYQAFSERKIPCASILWPVSGKNPYVRYNFPEVLALPGENPTLKMLRYGSPAWILHMEALYGRQRKSTDQPDLDDYAALLAEKVILARKFGFLAIHLVDCDAMRHRFGVNSPESDAALSRLDARIGRIMDAVRQASLDRETVFCLVSDHGQKDCRVSICLDRLLRERNLGRAQSLGMGAYVFPRNTEETIRELSKNAAQWGIREICTRDQLNRFHAPGGIPLAVDAADSVRFTDEGDEPHGGDHGFSLNEPQSRVIFLLSGAAKYAFKSFDSCSVVDIAPTLSRLFSLSMPDTDGKNLLL